ncbi:MAG TPA: hypothetical protein V6D14_15170 [Coleofasciculaceae cyanobacterium]|jgi:hypothetical protein
MKKSKATEALRVATDIAAIKVALYQRGYRLRFPTQTACMESDHRPRSLLQTDLSTCPD